MNFPLSLSFKIVALAPQIYVRDAAGQELLYVRQKLFKLKEQIHIYSDSAKSEELYQIAADRVIDFSARYTFTDAGGAVLGSIKRRGARSLWKAHYEVEQEGAPALTIEEENPWTKLLDGILGEIPILGAFTGYFLNPKFEIKDVASGQQVLRVIKHRSFLESKFEIHQTGGSLDDRRQTVAVLAILMMVLLERSRG